MATNIYGKINCYSETYSSSVGSGEQKNINEVYVQTYKFMQYLETQGVVELYSMFSGSNTPSFGVGYWDQTPRFGYCPWSVWRFKPNTNRNWDWYFLLQSTWNSHSNIGTAPANALPVAANTTNTTQVIHLLGQAAFVLSGSGPWNGTVNVSGSATKGTPVWTTNSFVFPRQNNSDGSHTTNKELMSSITLWNDAFVTMNERTRTHFFSDGDSILIVQCGAVGNPAYIGQNYNVYYFGPYTMIDAISQSNPGKVLGVTSSMGFLNFGTRATTSESDTCTLSTTTIPYGPAGHQVGTKTIVTSIVDGGIFATSDIGVRIGQTSYENYNSTQWGQNRLINSSGSVHMERAIMVISTEDSQTSGIAGWLNTPLIRSVVGLQSQDVRADGLRAVFGGNTVVTDTKITTPWSGSIPPGVGTTRDGTDFTILNYNL